MTLNCPCCKKEKDYFDFHGAGVSDRLCKDCLSKMSLPHPAPADAQATIAELTEKLADKEAQVKRLGAAAREMQIIMFQNTLIPQDIRGKLQKKLHIIEAALTGKEGE